VRGSLAKGLGIGGVEQYQTRTAGCADVKWTTDEEQ